MKKEKNFPGWEVWKQQNKEGMECTVNIKKTGNKIVTTTENLGLSIKNTTILKEKNKRSLCGAYRKSDCSNGYTN